MHFTIDKEIRLSFAQRIKNTLPEPYKDLIGPEMELETPEFKFANDCKSELTLLCVFVRSNDEASYSLRGRGP